MNHRDDFLPNGTTANPGQPASSPEWNARHPARLGYSALLTLRDTAALRLANLRPGTSAYKTAAGYLRGVQDSLGALGHG